MIDDESYSALYLYHALIEYIYFLIILIQDGGPNHLDNVSKYVKFFKRDVYTFIQTFDGKDFVEKVGQMLCSATSAFEVKDDVVHLTKNCSQFKLVAYEDFLVSKVVDLILRGICSVQDICQNLNFNSLISIKENDLIEMIKYYPYFHFNSKRSVVLLQFHGLIGFERHIYDTTVNYFQSYFQNVSKLTYSGIKLHSSCIPSCAIRNSLIVFCLLHVSPYFKCKGGKVSLRNRLKRKRNVKQVIGIEKLQSETPVGFLMHEAFGPVISDWKGEISRLFSCAGLIQSVVSFRNGQHGVFFVYFHKTALKHCCEIGDLKQFLNARDVVEFDAEFCGEIMRGQVFWEATKLKVVNRAIKQSNHEDNVDIEGYVTNVIANNFNIKPLLKVCAVTKCGLEYSAFEEIMINNKSSLEVQKRKVNVSEEFLTLASESDNSDEKSTVEIELDSNSSTSNCDVNITLGDIKSSDCINVLPYNSDDLLKADIQNKPNKCTEENALHNVVNAPGGITISKKSHNANSGPVLHANVPNKISEQNINLDSVYGNEESHCSIQKPKMTKICFEERDLSTHPNEVSNLHETENKSSSSVLCSNLPKEISNKSLYTVKESQYKCTIQVPKTTDECFEENNLFTHSNEALNPPETNDEDFSSVHCSNFPKEISNSITNLKNAEEIKCTNQVPKTTDDCFEEKNLLTYSNEALHLHETNNENFSSVHCSNLPKETSNSIMIQVPTMAKICFDEKEDLPTHLNKTSIPHEPAFSYINLVPNGPNNSTFLFGVVKFESTYDGMADSCFKNEPCKVFFEKNDICFQNGENLIGIGKTVFLFVPYVDIEDCVLIATFVHPLTPEETIEAKKNGFGAQDFIVNHFSRLIKRSLSDTYTCNCDISKSLLMSTQLRPNFNNDKKSSASEAIQRLSEVCKMSAKTFERLYNQFCVQNTDETCKKLFSILRFSFGKRTPSKIRSLHKLRIKSTSRSFRVNAKEETLNDYSENSCDNTQSIAFEEKTAAIDDSSGDGCNNTQSIAFEEKAAIDGSSGDSCDNTQSIAFEEKTAVINDYSENSCDNTHILPTVLLEPRSLEENCALDDNRNIVDLKALNNDHSIDQTMVKKDSLKVSRDSCRSVSSFSTCFEDLSSDDEFYSCESDFDSNPSSYKESPEKSKPSCGNEPSANGIDFKSWMPISPNQSFEIKTELITEKKFHNQQAKNSYLKLRRSSSFKHRKKKSKVILPTNNNYCKSCHKPSLTAVAEIIRIRKSCIYFELISEEDNTTLAFPKCLIPLEMQKRIRLNKTIAVILNPHPLLSLSQVMQVFF